MTNPIILFFIIHEHIHFSSDIAQHEQGNPGASFDIS